MYGGGGEGYRYRGGGGGGRGGLQAPIFPGELGRGGGGGEILFIIHISNQKLRPQLILLSPHSPDVQDPRVAYYHLSWRQKTRNPRVLLCRVLG